MSGNKIGVQMSFENMEDPRSVFFGSFQVNIHVSPRIDHHSFPP